MFTVVRSDANNGLAAVLKRAGKNRFFESSLSRRDPKTNQIIEFDKSEWPNSGPYKPNYKPIESLYPKAINRGPDLDGMHLSNNNADALAKGHVDQHLGETALEYMGDVRLPHPIWTRDDCDAIEVTHLKPVGLTPRLAYGLVWLLRRAFDYGTGYSLGFKNDYCMMRRVVILETVAGLPGMVGAAIRHFRSLRRGSRDYGWIHSLLEEAENERMHLMIAMTIYDPHPLVRFIVGCAQGLILPFYSIGYLISPKFCHSFVGYLEEEAVKTYTQMLELMDANKLPKWDCLAPEAARRYYHLPEGATMRDIITNIRADEAHHRELNHCLAWMDAKEICPFKPGF